MVALLLLYNSPGLSGLQNILQRNMFIDDKTIQILRPNNVNFRVQGKSNSNVLIIRRRI